MNMMDLMRVAEKARDLTGDGRVIGIDVSRHGITIFGRVNDYRTMQLTSWPQVHAGDSTLWSALALVDEQLRRAAA